MSLNLAKITNNRLLKLFSSKKIFSKQNILSAILLRNSHSPSADLDLTYLCDPKNITEIEENIKKRDSNANIQLVQDLYKKFDSSKTEKHWNNFIIQALKVPNKTLHHRDENEIIQMFGSVDPSGPCREFSDLTKHHGWCRTEHLGNLTGHRGYFFLGELAQLEQALIRLVVRRLLKEGFSLVSVPDILPSEAIENCGMPTKGERTQVYRLDERHGADLCMSGTAEMALAARLTNTKLPRASLPLRLAAVSRCFRAETSSVAEERGVYRVHQFTKVEMFGVTEGNFDASQKLQEEFVTLQKDLFSSLDLHYRVLDMASNELGNPAVRKLDLESWMPGRKTWGELCSCSDCGDFQSRRHNLKISDNDSFPHTVNGTACAIPRTLMAIVETHQDVEGNVSLPKPLHDIMKTNVLGKCQNKMPTMKYMRSNKQDSNL